jgi:fermentation-respiration switch protein FrsA (DUF1100 family)
MIGWLVTGLLVLAALSIVGFSIYVGWKLTHPPRKPLAATPGEYGMGFEEVRFPSADGEQQLAGWHIPARVGGKAKGTVIFSHGYAGNRLEEGLPALELAQSLTGEGYDVLMYDFRNCGLSSGTITTVGYYEQMDVLGAVRWVKENGHGPIALLGFSMGATSSLLAAAQDPAVAGVIADSPFSHLTRYLKRNLPVWTKLPQFPFTALIISILPPLMRTKPDEVDAEKAVDKLYPRPLLLIHSRADGAIPASHSEALAARHPDRFELWLTDGAPHVGSYRYDPDKYVRRVLSFLERLM